MSLARLVGYESTGTVEYLYNEEEKSFNFLELNPRLQVEHPCTEMVADINLPAAQLQIAMGIPLYRIKDIRLLYGEDPWGDSPIDFDRPKRKPVPRGHVIAARITSENPDEGFKPSSGTVQELTFRSSKNIWGYFSVMANGGLHEFADSQFGHLFSWGKDRESARENMAVALKELSIRGDFRTTVEYLIKLIETDSFQNNSCNTGWLDKLIMDKVQVEKPDMMLAVIVGSLHVADQLLLQNFQNFQATLERGQVLPANSLKHTIPVELIHEGIKYATTVTKMSPIGYFISTNGSFVEAEAHRLTDGGLLASIDGSSHTTYMKEEAAQYRIVIGNKTCVFDKDNDPTILRMPSTGKLVGFLVPDGGHVNAGDAFAEIEVMKMIMELKSNHSGCVQTLKRPGASLDAGTIIANLQLDDASKVQTSKNFEGQFPKTDRAIHMGEKLHQVFEDTKISLEQTLEGYCLPDPYFKERLEERISTLASCLKDPLLPLFKLQEIVSSLSGRIPSEVETSLRQSMIAYANNITSVSYQFPSQQIANILDSYAAKLTKRSDRDVYLMATQGINVFVQRFRNGLRGHTKLVVQDLINKYLEVEKLFQHGSYDKCVSLLRQSHKDNMAAVTKAIFSHSQVAKKNQLIVALIDHFCSKDPMMHEDFCSLLQQLTQLNKAENAKVALRARQVLITAYQSPYELRHNQVESIFLSAIDTYGSRFSPESLQKLITSETSIYDVLQDFFYHTNEVVRRAALEVYIQRAYTAYEIGYIHHTQTNTGHNLTEFMFLLPTTHPNRLNQRKNSLTNMNHLASALPRVGSFSDDSLIGHDGMFDNFQCHRMGVMVAFESFADFESCFDFIMERFKCPTKDFEVCSLDATKVSEPIHILNVAIRFKKKEEDESHAYVFDRFCSSKRYELATFGIRRITFLVLHKREFPKYFTFRSKKQVIFSFWFIL